MVEALAMTEAVRAMVLRHADAHALEEAAAQRGMRTMLRHGIERVIAGATSIEEVLRVTTLE